LPALPLTPLQAEDCLTPFCRRNFDGD